MVVAELHNKEVIMATRKSSKKSDPNKVTAASGNSRNLYDAAPQNTVHVNDATQYLPEGSATIGNFAVVKSGEHQGRYGVVEQVASFDSKGWPKTVIFRTRDQDSSRLTVDYDKLEAAEAGRR
jgi:hypothetical protein